MNKIACLVLFFVCCSFSIKAQKAGVIKIACIGASITEGAGLAHPAAEAYPQLLQLKLSNRYRVHNYGISGTTLLRKGDASYWNTNAYKLALQSQPDIVFIDLGGNDSKLINRGHLDEFEQDCHDLIRSFRQLPSHPRVILLLPLPCFLQDTAQIYDATIVSVIIPHIRNVAYADDAEVLDMHSLFVDKESLMPDKIHPNLEGAHIIASRLFELLALKTDRHFDIFSNMHQQFVMSSFYGYKCADFTFSGRNSKIVQPKYAAKNHPWIWRARFWGHEPQTDIALLEHGFYVVYCDVAEMFGNEEAVSIWNAFYAEVHDAGLGDKAVLEGMSRGAVYALNWAAVNTGKVACVYIDNPVLDLKMWPGGLGKYPASPDELDTLKADYHLKDDNDLKNFKGSPIDKTVQIAKGKYPILILCADADEAVNPQENTLVFEQKIKKLHGKIAVVHKPGFKHHPHSLPNPTLIVEFILHSLRQMPAYKNVFVPADKMTIEKRVEDLMDKAPAVRWPDIPAVKH